MSFLSYIRNIVGISSLLTFILVMTGSVTNANELLCTEKKSDRANTFCEQTARHEALEQTWDLLKMVMDIKKEKSQFQPTDDTITKVLYYNKSSENLHDTSTNNWPRPKVINRYFETAVASLDIDGKNDLETCAKHGLLNDSQVIDAPEHQLTAIINFSQANLKELTTANANSNSEFSLRSCTQLINLVLGNT